MSKSLAYRLIKKAGLNISSQEYGDISFYAALKRAFKGWRHAILLKYSMHSVLLTSFNYRLIRPKIWRKIGCKVGQDVFIGYGVWFDYNHSENITIGNKVHIANNCILLCHKRNLDDYNIGDDSTALPYTKGEIIIEDGAMIGMGSIIMPNVRIGKGSMVGAGSVVLHNIPAWSVAAGNPARVIRKILKKEIHEHIDI